MGIRQLRISEQGEIFRRIGEFQGKPIQIVLANSTSFTGVLSRVDGEKIILENMRRKKMLYPISAIAEIYVDTHA